MNIHEMKWAVNRRIHSNNEKKPFFFFNIKIKHKLFQDVSLRLTAEYEMHLDCVLSTLSHFTKHRNHVTWFVSFSSNSF